MRIAIARSHAALDVDDIADVPELGVECAEQLVLPHQRCLLMFEKLCQSLHVIAGWGVRLAGCCGP